MRPFLQLGGLLILLFGMSACPAPTNSIQIEEAWIRAAPPGSHMMAAYAQITNNGQNALDIQTFSSPAFDEVSFHQTIEKNGTAKMVEVKEYRIDPDQTLALIPGSYHLMLMNLEADLSIGQNIPITITFSNDYQQTVQFVVKKP